MIGVDERALFVTPQGVEYALSDEDLLLLGRSLLGEAGAHASSRHYSAVAWTELHRYLLWPRGPRWRTFSQFLSNFSSPLWLNPDVRDREWADLPGTIRHHATAFARGELVPEAEWVDFAADWWAQTRPGFDAAAATNIGGNLFFTRDQEPMVEFRPGPIEVLPEAGESWLADHGASMDWRRFWPRFFSLAAAGAVGYAAAGPIGSLLAVLVVERR